MIYIISWILYLFFVHNVIRFYIPNYDDYTISSIIVSLTHALTTILYSGYIINNYLENDSFNSYQYHLINISTGYFVYDAIFMCIHHFSLMFFLHHILILFVYYVATSYELGAKLVIYTLFWGEITNPLQISWYLSKYLNYNKIRDYVFPIFSFNFILVRCLIMPYYHYITLYELFNQYNNYLPKFILLFFAIIGDIGSLIWVKSIIKKIV